MRVKNLVYCGALLVLTALAAWWVRKAEPGAPAAVVEAPAPRARPMFLALASDLQVGAFLEKRDLVWREWNGSTDELELSRYFVRGVAKLEDLVGGVLRVQVKGGDFLQAASFVRPGDTAFLAAVLKAGGRAITIPVDEVSGSAGLIQPGNHVDVILAGRLSSPAGEARRLMARTVLENVRVIAIDRRVESLASERIPAIESKSGKGTATLEVTPQQAEWLALARGLGELSLSLRSLLPSDSPAQSSRGVYASDIIHEEPAAQPVARAAKVQQFFGTEQRDNAR